MTNSRRRSTRWMAMAAAALTLTGIVCAVPAYASGAITISRSSLDNGGRPCATDVTAAPRLNFDDFEAIAGNLPTANGLVSFDFAVWPADDPTLVHDASVSAVAQAPRARVQFGPALISGETYYWRVRATASSVSSHWSATCAFVWDTTSPAKPRVTSPYSETTRPKLGTPTIFTFHAPADSDVAGFVWSTDNYLTYPACSYSGPLHELQCPANPFARMHGIPLGSDGTARIEYDPTWLVDTIYVWAVDTTGNASPYAEYRFEATWSGPVIAPAVAVPSCGASVKLEITPQPGLRGVVGYFVSEKSGVNGVYHPAEAGRSLYLSRPIDARGSAILYVRSVSSNGFVSNQSSYWLITDSQPSITSTDYPAGVASGGVGVPGTFSIGPAERYVSAPVSFTVTFDSGAPITVPADPTTWTASLTYTPTTAGPHTATVAETTTDGDPTCPWTYAFTVAG